MIINFILYTGMVGLLFCILGQIAEMVLDIVLDHKQRTHNE